MPTTPMSAPFAWLSWSRACLVLIASLLGLRLVMLYLSPLGLHGDEAQYWAWSKDLDWGYFTKPPLIAGIIRTTTALFGNVEWAVRLASPVLHAVTTFVIFQTARFLYDDKTGFWAAALFLLMPAVWLSSGIISTDVPLLLCWAVALNAWVHLRDAPNWSRTCQLGLAIGIGLLAKYAMLFFLPTLILACLFDPPTRRALNTVKGYTAGLMAVFIILPNILWNIQHDFATFVHTTENANIQSGIPFHPGALFTFLGEQFGVFGPVTGALLGLALIAALRQKLTRPAVWLAVFTLIPLTVISLQALLSRANANWAVTAFVSGAILAAHYGVHYWPRLKVWLIGGVAAQSLICFIFSLGIIIPVWGDALGLANSVKRLRAWPETVAALEQRFEAGHEGQPYENFAVDKRIIFYDLKYYDLEETAPIYMWMFQSHPSNHAELTAPLPASDGPTLLINYHTNYEERFREDFTRLEPLPGLEIDLGGGKYRVLKLWAGYGYHPTITR